MKENLILVDFVPETNWKFKNDLEKRTGVNYKVIIEDTHNLQGKLSGIRRYISYFIVPLKYMMKRNQIECIVAWQQFYGLIFAFWMRLFHVKKRNKLIVMTFIYKKRKGILGKIYFAFMKYIVCSAYVDVFQCFSEHECEMYSEIFDVPKNKFVSCGLTIEDEYDAFKKYIKQGDYYLAAGRSNRDYQYLCDEFKNIVHEKVIVLCDKYKIENKPESVEFKESIYGNTYKEYLAASKAAIIPLKKEGISAGQLAIIQAMMFGKPVIVTETETTLEYVKDGYNAIVIKNKTKDIVNAIKMLDDQIYYSQMSANARTTFEENFTGKELAFAIGDIVNSLKEK